MHNYYKKKKNHLTKTNPFIKKNKLPPGINKNPWHVNIGICVYFLITINRDGGNGHPGVYDFNFSERISSDSPKNTYVLHF